MNLYRLKEQRDVGQKPYWYITNWGFFVNGSLSHSFEETHKIYVELLEGKRKYKRTLFKNFVWW